MPKPVLIATGIVTAAVVVGGVLLLTNKKDGAESKAVISDLKKTKKEHTNEERHKNCAAAEHGLETKLSNLSKNAAAFQVKISGVLNKAIAFQKDHNVTVANFDALVAAAHAARTQSASSISALGELDANLDCNQPDVAQHVASFKVAATKAKTDLKAYKEAVKAILVALENTKEGN